MFVSWRELSNLFSGGDFSSFVMNTSSFLSFLDIAVSYACSYIVDAVPADKQRKPISVQSVDSLAQCLVNEIAALEIQKGSLLTSKLIDRPSSPA